MCPAAQGHAGNDVIAAILKVYMLQRRSAYTAYLAFNIRLSFIFLLQNLKLLGSGCIKRSGTTSWVLPPRHSALNSQPFEVLCGPSLQACVCSCDGYMLGVAGLGHQPVGSRAAWVSEHATAIPI